MSFASGLDEDSALPADGAEEDEADGCCPPEGAEADLEAEVADARAVVGLGGCKRSRMFQIRFCMLRAPLPLRLDPSFSATNALVNFSGQSLPNCSNTSWATSSAEADAQADVADSRAGVGLGGCKLRRML